MGPHMQLEEIIGKTVTNIYALVKMEVGGLDTCECFVELDNKTIIDIPFGFSDNIWVKKLDSNALNLFADLSDYQAYEVEYRENKLKNLKDRKIIDFLWYADDSEKGLILLDNGYIITETTIAPHGTGLAGLNFYENINDLILSKGNDYSKLTDKKDCL
jgi:hypothetical protein